MTEQCTVVALPLRRRGNVKRGTRLRLALRSMGVQVESICAENGTCGKCKVLVEDGDFPEFGISSSPGNLSPAGAEESEYFRRRASARTRSRWKPGRVRLACQAHIRGDIVITVPDESRVDRQIVRKSAQDREIVLNPSLRKYLVELAPPTLANPGPDWGRLASGIATSIGLVRAGEPNLPRPRDLTIDSACLRSLPDALRRSNWRVTVSVWQDKEILEVEPGYSEALYGAAVDIGTTTVAAYVCDLRTGDILATAAAMNPQIEFGEDVMSRIQFADSDPKGTETLHRRVIRCLNQILLQAVADAGISADRILELVVVGNTTMLHFLLRLPTHDLGVAPYVPATCGPIDIKARHLGLVISKSANVHVLPAIGSFVGADATAVLLAEGPHNQDEPWLIIDIGTNAELVLGNRNRLLCASTPTGPAFEGGHIEHGMRAAPGAIEHLLVEDSSWNPRWKLVGEEEWGRSQPKGLCGSAVVDAVAELVRVGAIDSSGRFADQPDNPRIRSGAGGTRYVIAYADETSIQEEISITQKDIRQIQLAKAALFVAAESLLSAYGLQEPHRIVLAGAFGSYIDKSNAMAIGMLPRLDPERVDVVGNAAGDGARIALLNKELRKSAVTLADRVGRQELPVDPTFHDRFIRSLPFPS